MTLSIITDRGTLRGSLRYSVEDYNILANKPQINGNELVGNKSGHELGLANLDDVIYVEANPVGAPEEDLTKLQVGGHIFGIPEGTKVEANPVGPSSGDLSRILIDDAIYDIAGQIVYGKASGAIASFDDGGDNKPLKSLKVAINPVQASGTPTPENPIPIYGWTGAEIERTGKNLFDNTSITISDITFNSTNGEITRNGFFYNLPAGTYTISMSGTFQNYIYLNVLQSDGTFVSRNIISGADSPYNNRTFTLNEGDYIAIYKATSGQLLTLPENVQIEVGSEATSFEAYNGTTYPITWRDEIRGGVMDVTDGVIHPYKYYSSYNGEPLVGEWQSSMDVYAEGTTPTIGAQVVDFGAYDTDIDVECPTITTLLGNNNIWSDTGEIEECVYQRDLNIVINKLLQQ